MQVRDQAAARALDAGSPLSVTFSMRLAAKRLRNVTFTGDQRVRSDSVAKFLVADLSYNLSYTCPMAVVNFRTDERSERALAELTADGSTVSDAIREALVDAVRLRRREKMRMESLEVSGDADDRSESKAVLREMDQLRAW